MSRCRSYTHPSILELCPHSHPPNMIFNIKAPCHNQHEWYMNAKLKIGHAIVRHSAL